MFFAKSLVILEQIFIFFTQKHMKEAFFTNDAIVLGILLTILTFVFITSESKNPFWKNFYKYVPSLLLCYFIPALFNSPLGLISGETSKLYFVASRYLLPACLTLLCVSIDLKAIWGLGSKALIMFLTGTLGVILGAPFALVVVTWIAPDIFGNQPEVWRGFSTIAGSWIGGGANQAAMKEIYKVSDSLFASMLVIDITVANIWMGFLLFGANMYKKIDAWLKADASAIEDIKEKIEKYNASIAKIPTTTDYFKVLAVAFGSTALSHWGAELITPITLQHADFFSKYNLTSLTEEFFWIVVISTTVGLLLSLTKARQLEGVGASKFGSVFIYILVAAIGMKMDLMEIFDKDKIGLILVGFVWMGFHAGLLILVAKLIKAPFFFLAVGSQANIGGAASAPIVASVFSPSLAPVGVLLAVLGYALGTYGAIIAAQLMILVSP